MWLVVSRLRSICDVNFQTPTLVATLKSLSFFLFPKVEFLQGCLLPSTEEGDLHSESRVLPITFPSAGVPGRKGLQLLIVKAASRGRAISSDEEPCL